MVITTERIGKNLFLIRVDDRETRFFEALWEIPEGINYNSYLLNTAEGSVLFDTVHKDFSEGFIESLRNLVDLKEIKYLVVSHMEPDHSGSMKELLNLNKDITVIASSIAKKQIEGLFGLSPRFKAINDGEILSFGGVNLKFLHAPWLHWPETIFTYIDKEKALITGDVFGSFSLSEHVKNLDASDISQEEKREMKKYFVDVIGAYRQYVLKALEKVVALKDVEAVCPSHGSVFLGRESLRRLSSLYSEWASCREATDTVSIVYSSMYGFSKKIAEFLSNELRKMGYHVDIFEFSSKMRSNYSDAIAAIDSSNINIIISSTYENEPHPLIKFFVELASTKVCKNRKFLVVSTYGWGDIAAKKLSEELTQKGFIVVEKISIHSSIKSLDEERLRNAISQLLKE